MAAAGNWMLRRPSVGEVTIVNPAYLLGSAGSYAVQHAVLGQLGKHPEIDKQWRFELFYWDYMWVFWGVRCCLA